MQYKTGLFKIDDFICYMEYYDTDILERPQFKIYYWLGKDVENSWDGHSPWDFDAALFFEKNKCTWYKGPIYSNTCDGADGNNSDNVQVLVFDKPLADTFQKDHSICVNAFVQTASSAVQLINAADIKQLIEEKEYEGLLEEKYKEVGLLKL